MVPRVPAVATTQRCDASSDRLAEVASARRLPCTVILHLFPCCTVWTEVVRHSPHLRRGELCSTSWRVGCSHKLFGTLLNRKIVYSPPFIYLFGMISISVWTHGYSFCTLGSNILLLYLRLKLFHVWPLGALSVGSWVPLAYSHHCGFFSPF